MKRFVHLVIFFGVVALLIPCEGIAQTQQQRQVDSDIKNNPVCRAVSAFTVAVAFAPATRNIETALGIGLAAAGIEISGASDWAQQKCERGLQDFVDYYERNPVDYDDFVREQCGGNPYNCPGTFNVNQPSGCSYLIVCSPFTVSNEAFAHRVSVEDMVHSLQITRNAVVTGNWSSWWRDGGDGGDWSVP